MQNNLVTSILQWIATAITIMLPIIQYIFRDNFKFLFGKYENLFSISTAVALVLSFAIIIILYANRYVLGSRMYFSKKNKDKYFASFKNASKNTKNTQENMYQNKYNSEPRYFNVYHLAIISIPISLLAFSVFISGQQKVWIVCVSYVLFISAIIFSIATFAIKLYTESRYKVRVKEVDNLILEKVRAYFVGEMKIKNYFTDNNFPSTKYIIVEYQNKNYFVKTDASDPERFFSIEEKKDEIKKVKK